MLHQLKHARCLSHELLAMPSTSHGQSAAEEAEEQAVLLMTSVLSVHLATSNHLLQYTMSPETLSEWMR